MKEKRSKVNVFDYTDYRKYLLDYYNEQKRKRKAFSYRYFARKAGINSIGLYRDVINGRQSLGRSLIFKFSQAIGHGEKEAEYFENMVYFNEAKSVEERKLFFERMMASYRSKARIVDASKYEYYSRWYYSAVRALLSCRKFSDTADDYKNIAKALNPPIRPEQAKKATKVLEKLEFIKRGKKGFYELCDDVITTGIVKTEKNIASLNVINFQKEMMRLAGESFDRNESDQLDMSTLTLGISRSTLKEIKKELIAFRQKVAGMAERDNNPEIIYQFNQQLFPLSRGDRERNCA